MKKSSHIAAAAITGIVGLGLGSMASTAIAAEGDMEKCYGVVKAGKNDCQTATSACAGTSTEDGQRDAWLLVPEGTCERLVGGTTDAPS